MIVIYWPSIETSCTCVNKRKKSGIRWTIENNITRCPDGSSQLKIGFRSDNQLQTGGFEPLVTPGWATQAKIRKKCCYGRGRTWVNIAVCLCLHSFLTHNKHHLFENKVWEIYIRKCIRSLLKSSLSADYVPVYICIRIVYYATPLRHPVSWTGLFQLKLICSETDLRLIIIASQLITSNSETETCFVVIHDFSQSIRIKGCLIYTC